MEAITARWKRVPPASIMLCNIASALGVKLEGEKKKKTGDLSELVAALGGAPGFTVKGGNG